MQPVKNEWKFSDRRTVVNCQCGAISQSRKRKATIKICWDVNTDIKKQYTESKVEKATHTFAHALLYKAKAITDSGMFGKIRNNKYIK